jgi:hypothetical protein
MSRSLKQGDRPGWFAIGLKRLHHEHFKTITHASIAILNGGMYTFLRESRAERGSDSTTVIYPGIYPGAKRYRTLALKNYQLIHL